MLCPTLVGRDVELATLETLLGEATARGGRVVLIAGDAGIGKSRFLDVFLDRARASGAHTVIGYCVEAEARRPFGPFIDALRVSPIESDGALAEPDGRYRALRSFAAKVAEIAKQAPLVLAIDDLQWADEGTLELFEYLARTLRENRVLLAAAYRSDELDRLHPLRAVLASLARSRAVDSVNLRPLSVADTSELVGATLALASAAPKDLVAALVERCEGNPFYLEEMLKALVEAGTLVRREGSWQHDGRIADLIVPASVRDVVQARLALLPADARSTLHVAAVIGTSFDVALLQQVSALTDGSVTSALHAAVDGQFVEEVPGGPIDRFRFRHALTREAVLADLLGRERRALHGKVAAAIAAAPGSVDRAEALAYHFDEAGDAASAHANHLRASEHATSIYAFGQARRHLERALELASADSDLADLNSRLSRASLQAGDGRGALRAAEEARARYEQRADPRGIGRALCEMSDAYWHLGRADDARQTAAEGVRVLEASGAAAELTEAYRRMTDLALFDDDPQTEYWAERTIESARRSGQRASEILGLIGLGGALGRRGSVLGLAHAEEALRLATELGAPDLAFRAQLFVIDITAKLGGGTAERRAQYLAMVADAKRRAYSSDQMLTLEVEEAIALGAFDDALRLTGQITPDSLYGADAELRVALIRVARGGPDSAPDLEAIRRRLNRAAIWWNALATTTAQVWLLAGRPGAALEHAEPAKAHLRAGSQRFGVDVAVICAIEAAWRLKDNEALDGWIAAALADEPGEPGSDSLIRQARRAFASAGQAIRNGDLGAAISFSAASVAALDHSQWPFVETVARLRHAELLLKRAATNDAAGAAAELATVLSFWRGAGAPWYVGRLRDWAREHGMRIPAALASTGAASQLLTRRQQEIASLIATGLTNREIADRLVISERTVESHVEGIMGKLAVHNRVEIASRVVMSARV